MPFVHRPEVIYPWRWSKPRTLQVRWSTNWATRVVLSSKARYYTSQWTIVPHIYQVSSQSHNKCKRSLLYKLEKIYADKPTRHRKRPKACDWHTDCCMPHCNTFVHVNNLLSRYLIWHISENCKQYTVKEKHMFLQNYF